LKPYLVDIVDRLYVFLKYLHISYLNILHCFPTSQIVLLKIFAQPLQLIQLIQRLQHPNRKSLTLKT
jgi:hypothetical protein